MKKKTIVRGLWILLALLVAGGLFYTTRKEKENVCTEISVQMEGREEGCFLTEAEIIKFLYKNNDTLTGNLVHEIDVSKLERQLKQIPYIADADVYFTLQGVLKVRIQQRRPIARLFDQYNHSVFLADDGMIIPVSKGISKRLLVVNGEFPDTLSEAKGRKVGEARVMPILTDIFKTASFLDRDTFYSALISQIYLNNQQEMELIPSIDDHIILIGNSDSLDFKFHKLLAFYQKGMTRTGWDAYGYINLKYSNQVICTTK